MYFAKMTFTMHNPVEIANEIYDDYGKMEKIADPIWAYLGSLYRNGNIANYKDIHDGSVFHAYFCLPEKDSTNEEYYNDETLKALENLKTLYEIRFEILGEDTDGLFECKCNEPSYYILWADKSSASPVVCGDCLKFIPLYKLPDIVVPDNTPLGWFEDYVLIEKLWWLGDFDSYTYKQMSDPNSRLSRNGKNICTAYEKAIGKPFYYFLFHHDFSTKKHNDSCPICGTGWSIVEDKGFALKCDTCRLVSGYKHRLISF